MKVYYWSPFISNVATTSAVINSIKSIKKFSKNKINCKILNVFKEWDYFKKEIDSNNIDLIDLKTSIDIKNLPTKGFIKSRITYLITYVLSIVKLHLLLKKNKPEFLIIHLITSIPLSLLILFNYETKFILRVSGYPKLNFWRSILWKIADKKLYKIFCPTILTQKLLLRKKVFKKEKLFVVRDPIIDVKDISKKRKDKIDHQFNWIKDKNYILSIGRLSKQKNYKFLIKNFANISKKYPNLDLVIIGEGEEEKKLKDLIKINNLEKKIFLVGKKKNIYPYLFNALFFVLTSDWEDPGFVIIESMFTRKIIFSSNCKNGPIEIIDDHHNGFLYERNDQKDFENKFDLVMKIVSLDKKEKNQILYSAIKKTKLFSLFNHYKDISPHLN